jgi:hypothetical protein
MPDPHCKFHTHVRVFIRALYSQIQISCQKNVPPLNTSLIFSSEIIIALILNPFLCFWEIWKLCLIWNLSMTSFAKTMNHRWGKVNPSQAGAGSPAYVK